MRPDGEPGGAPAERDGEPGEDGSRAERDGEPGEDGSRAERDGEPGGDGARAEAVGFIGLGQIGAPMAARLTGWAGGLIVHDARPEAMAPLADAGARAATSVAEVAAAAGIVSVMVRDDDQARDVVRAAAAAAAGRPVIIAVHATIGPDTAAELAAELAGTGVEVIDAPVSGGFMGAQAGRLAVMFGGSRAAYDRCRGPFGCWADLIMYMGPVGAGTRAKLARNLLHFAAFTAAAEAQRLAEAAGIDLRKLAKVVRHSDAVTGGPGMIMLRTTTAPMDDADPLRDILQNVRALGEKDLSLALELGEELGVDLPMARLALGSFAVGLGLPGPGLPDPELPDAQLPDPELPDTELPDTELPDAELPETREPAR